MSCRDSRPAAALAAALTLSLLPLGGARACGPDFPYRLLDDRAGALAQLPDGSFAREVQRLGAPIDGLGRASAATLPRYWDAGAQFPQQRSDVERTQLSAAQFARIEQLRALDDARRVEREGADLPPELRLYTAGAVAFAQGQYPSAADYFRQVLALPEAQRRARSTWAAYSLGRSLALGAERALPGDAAAQRQADREQAQQAFQQTRTLRLAGFDDPLELGIASLGEEARLLLAAGDWNGAIGLYAVQAAQGSATGMSSLQQVAADLARRSDAALAPLLRQQAVRRLLIAKLLSDTTAFDPETGSALSSARFLRLLQDVQRDPVEDADRLAALAYRQGDYPGTARLLAHAGDSGLAWWLRAKMALRDGDAARAAQAYAQASRRFPPNEDWGTRRAAGWSNETVKPQCRIDGEAAILALQRGSYVEAFAQLYRSGDLYWEDAAAVAERVLTVQELQDYVDRHVPAAPPAAADATTNDWERTPPLKLRELLARRLMRTGHYDDALPYFAQPELREAARRYRDARRQAASAWTGIGRAEGHYQAALIARRHGMELLGYELGPDNRVYAGNYADTTPHARLRPGGLVAAAEAQRWDATAAQPYRRYHYRWIAAALADRAADDLPARSQAYAAVLCQATDWLITLDPAQARRSYQRYVAHGALNPVPGKAYVFGVGACETPDFDGARRRLWSDRGQALRQFVHAHRLALGATGLALLTAAGWLLRRRMRRKARTATASPPQD
ncbi:hypothetical protein FHR56_001381 [Xanthomonas sacchari]|uniref:hypothetical protein n=1 Tax=unclassified Xanthomonas TaxID=2643310 RepID=UPI001369024D|nr:MULTISPECIES: hypothetical protein [unclassified Xanthomonas]MBB6366268.1 hypothetical protein [Xanthomonas sp. F10]MXV33684.1 hypothetical protein [Xanthomonas sp. LMG 8989]